MRRAAGAFLRRKFLERTVSLVALSFSVVGIGAGMLLQAWLPQWAVLIFFALGVIFFLTWRIVERKAKWSLDNIEKGRDAETQVGQCIEYAITSPNCAVAHNVQEIAKGGDIDHLVATPVRLWVVETKANRVPTEEFSAVLSRIGRKVQAVRAWAPEGTQVSGCLTLAQGKHEPSYRTKSEKIFAENPETLMKRLRKEAQESPTIAKDLPRQVWALGKIDEK